VRLSRGDRTHPPRSELAPEVLFVAGALAQYGGAAIAVGLFDEVGPVGMAWLRGLTAGVVLLLWRPPWHRTWAAAERRLVVLFGVVTVLMNLSFYLSIDRLPLGNAVAIEFLGPVAVAAVGARTARNWLALALAGGGVLLLAGVELDGDLLGVVFALASACLWAVHILLGSGVARWPATRDGLGVAFLAGSALVGPLAIGPARPAFEDPRLLLAAVGVGICSTAIPYVLDQVVFRRMDAHRFALLLAILPTTAAVVGWLALGQLPTVAEAAGIGAVVTAVVVRDRPPPVLEISSAGA
jgi:inner membrane transporter RhtA